MSVRDDENVKLKFDPERALRVAAHFKHMLFLDRDAHSKIEILERIVDIMIQQYPHDFTWSQSFEPEWFKLIMKVGFLPIASQYGKLVSTFTFLTFFFSHEKKIHSHFFQYVCPSYINIDVS